MPLENLPASLWHASPFLRGLLESSPYSVPVNLVYFVFARKETNLAAMCDLQQYITMQLHFYYDNNESVGSVKTATFTFYKMVSFDSFGCFNCSSRKFRRFVRPPSVIN